MTDEEPLAELFWTVGRALRHSARQALAGWDLSPSQARALGALAGDGPIRLGELADHLRIAPRSATEVVDQLEARQLVRRAADAQDRRATVVQLTDDGSSLADSIRRVRGDQAEQVFDMLDAADRAELTRLLMLLRDRSGPPAGTHQRSHGQGSRHGRRA